MTRVAESDRRDGDRSATKSRASSGHDVRRDLARAVVSERLGAARAAADAHEPRGIFLSLTTEEAPNAGGGTGRNGDVSMRNILAIAQQGAEVVLRVADRLHRHRPLRAAVRLLLRRHPAATSSAEHADGPVRRRAAVDERQPAADPAAAAERHDPRPVPDADGHDADLLGGEALGHDRAAAHLAAHRLPDHHRQVPRRDGALRRACSPSR